MENVTNLIERMQGHNPVDRCEAMCAPKHGVVYQRETKCSPREKSCFECLMVRHPTDPLFLSLIFGITNAPGMPPGHDTLQWWVHSWACMELGERVRPQWESEQSVQSVHPGILLSSKAASLICVKSAASKMCSGMQWRRQSCCRFHSFHLSGHYFHDVMIIFQKIW